MSKVVHVLTGLELSSKKNRKIDSIDDVSFFPIVNLGLSNSEIENLKFAFRDKPNVLQESINNFAMDMADNMRYRYPSKVFIGVMLKGDGRWNLPQRLCKDERQKRREIKERTMALKRKIHDKHFYDDLARWYTKHTIEQIKALSKKLGVLGTISSFEPYFFKEIWPDALYFYIEKELEKKGVNVVDFVDYTVDADNEDF